MVSKIANRRLSCRSCGEYVFPGERYTELTEGKTVRKYCRFCKSAESGGGEDGEEFLRSMEDFAAYRAAGCSEAYWSDRDNGYAY